jgi:SAM-dependent methyltransferase
MQTAALAFLRCPLSGETLSLMNEKFSSVKSGEVEVGILITQSGAAYPILEGVPRLLPDSFFEHRDFLRQHLDDYEARESAMIRKFGTLLALAERKNRRTRGSFSKEWQDYDYQSGKTWNMDVQEQLEQFFRESAESPDSLKGRIMLDAGCGNGQLAMQLASSGATVFAMDFSSAVVRAASGNPFPSCHFIQADVEFPPFENSLFRLIHSSGVLIHTRNTRNAFRGLLPFLADDGKMSIWVYRHRQELLHRLFNQMREFTARMPAAQQHFFLRYLIFYPAFLLKKMKGSRQRADELWVEVMDWFTPEYRWEHDEEEVLNWYRDSGFATAGISDQNYWGFSVLGERISPENQQGN